MMVDEIIDVLKNKFRDFALVQAESLELFREMNSHFFLHDTSSGRFKQLCKIEFMIRDLIEKIDVVSEA